MRRRKQSLVVGGFGWALVLGLALLAPEGCATRDCAEEREGTVRCVGNQLERCVDGDVLYEPCTSQGLICSEFRQGCVTQDVIDQDNGGAGGTGAGGDDGSGGDGGS